MKGGLGLNEGGLARGHGIRLSNMDKEVGRI
jgi:hypothetical protein